MDRRQQAEGERMNKVAVYLTPRLTDFDGNKVAKIKMPLIIQRVANISSQREAQIAGGGNATQKSGVARNQFQELLDAMKDFVNFATVMGIDIPALENKFRMPRSRSRRAVIAAARVFAADAVAFKSDFVNYGLPATFIEDLLAKADSLEQTLAEQSSATESRVGAGSELDNELKEISVLIRQIDPIIKMVYRNDPANLAAWTFANHIQRFGKSKPKPPTP
jgi:hypothetical protein